MLILHTGEGVHNRHLSCNRQIPRIGLLLADLGIFIQQTDDEDGLAVFLILGSL